jgi:hypothetical protein
VVKQRHASPTLSIAEANRNSVAVIISTSVSAKPVELPSAS